MGETDGRTDGMHCIMGHAVGWPHNDNKQPIGSDAQLTAHDL